MQEDTPAYRLAFPGLTEDNHILTSPEDDSYNCMGHATHTALWWSPAESRNRRTYWPPNVPRVNKIESYQKALEDLGYTACENESFENGFEKIAIFAKGNIPKHVARQLDEKFWTSKLGQGIDISHALQALCGYNFGDVAVVMKRPKR